MRILLWYLCMLCSKGLNDPWIIIIIIKKNVVLIHQQKWCPTRSTQIVVLLANPPLTHTRHPQQSSPEPVVQLTFHPTLEFHSAKKRGERRGTEQGIGGKLAYYGQERETLGKDWQGFTSRVLTIVWAWMLSSGLIQWSGFMTTMTALSVCLCFCLWGLSFSRPVFLSLSNFFLSPIDASIQGLLGIWKNEQKRGRERERERGREGYRQKRERVVERQRQKASKK